MSYGSTEVFPVDGVRAPQGRYEAFAAQSIGVLRRLTIDGEVVDADGAGRGVAMLVEEA